MGIPTGTTYRKLKAEDNKQNKESNSESNSADKAISNDNSSEGKDKNKLKPDKEAQGDHTTFKRDENNDIFKYQLWKMNERNPNGFDADKRFDGGKPNGNPGKAHVDRKTGKSIPTPHINEPRGGVRIPEPGEYPNNQ